MESAASLKLLAQAAEDDFATRFGRPPRWVVAAPGRVNLIGEHTDYNDGFVLPMAIDRHVVIAADRSEENGGPRTEGGEEPFLRSPSSALRPSFHARLFSHTLGQWASVPLSSVHCPLSSVHWGRYVQGVIAGCLDAGLNPGPFDAVVHADVPLGGGLSSSAALEAATATLVEAMTGVRLDPLRKALLCQKAEHDFAGVPCGIMDQIASIQGRAGALLLLDCRSRTVEWTPFADPHVCALIVNSNVKHALTDGGYAVRRRQCEEAARLLGVPALRDVGRDRLESARGVLDDVHFRRARHVVSEIERTVQTAAALRRGDWDAVGRHMVASHASLRDDYEVSCEELDVLVELAAAIGPDGGVIGARMTGGGFGGCTISLVRRDALDQIIPRIREEYLQKTGREATLFVTHAVDGARELTCKYATGRRENNEE